MNGLVIVTAYILDLLFGDPHWLPHPVRAIGWLIQRFETILRSIATTPRAEKIAGVALVILTVFPVYILSHSIILFAYRLSSHLGFAVSAVLAYTTLAARGLADAARSVLKKLDEGDAAGARKELSMIVGRDTQNLDEPEIIRAVVETVAENASDGVIAPLVYLAIGGPALALAYKAVNTLDSMVGYKNERYLHFGWAAARLDDIANFVPARITAVLICFSASAHSSLRSAANKVKSVFQVSAELRTVNIELQNPWRIMHRDHGNHPSPNSGYPEAAMAGALGIRLGGPSTYAGQLSMKPFIGDPGSPIVKKHIEKSIQLLYSATLIAVVVVATMYFFLNIFSLTKSVAML
jgi:adenosylcobinamide-phosphate synthase